MSPQKIAEFACQGSRLDVLPGPRAALLRRQGCPRSPPAVRALSLLAPLREPRQSVLPVPPPPGDGLIFLVKEAIMSLSSTMMCAGCGCTNDRACRATRSSPVGCFWVWFDKVARVGLCSRCISWPPSAAHPSQLVRKLARQWRRLIREAQRIDRVLETYGEFTWTKPAGTTRVTILAVCGGGGGGRAKR